VRLTEPLVGMAFGLRSPAAGDAQFTVELRCDPQVARFLHAIPGDLGSQLAWESKAVGSQDDLPLVVFRRSTGRPEGTVGIYRIDPPSGTAEWGRWVLRRASVAASESVLLVFTVAFETLGLDSLYCRTLADNSRAIGFHDSLGLSRELTGFFDMDGRSVPFVQHRIDREMWPETRTRLQTLASGVGRRLA
jgi:RimJ/RimL family protein N-acetyltransferase